MKTLYNTGQFPLWIRIPALAFGIFILWFSVVLAAYGLFGVRSFGFEPDVHGSPLLGSLACFAIAALFIFVWFCQERILFDETRQELIVSSRGYTRWHERRVSLTGCREFHICFVRGSRGSTSWRVSVEFADGRSEWLTDISSESAADSFADLLKEATKFPVVKYPNEKSLEETSKREIISCIVAFTVIPGIIITVCVIGIAESEGSILDILFCGAGLVFASIAATTSIWTCISELRRRKYKQ